MIIRQATEQDWPLIYPIYAAIMAEGKTYPFPEGQSLAEARPLTTAWSACTSCSGTCEADPVWPTPASPDAGALA